MVNTKITDLSSATAATGDELVINDVTDTTDKKVTAASIVDIITGDITVNSSAVAALAANSVDSSELVDGGVDLSHMSVNSIDSDQYVDASIDLAHMSINSIDSNQYVDGSIDSVHLTTSVFSSITGLGTQTQDMEFNGLNIQTIGVLTLKEQAEADADVAGEGQFWVDTRTPNMAFFTDDAGTDFGINGYVTLNFIIDGGGSAITTGKKGVLIVDFPCTVDEWAIIGEPDGAIVVDVNRSTFGGYPTTSSIAGTELPTIAATNDTGEDRTLSSWSTIAAGDIIEFEVDSITTCERVTVALKVRRT